MWRLQFLEKHTDVILREFFFHTKPSVFLLGDYGLGTTSASTLLIGKRATAIEGDWELTEIVPVHEKVDPYNVVWQEFQSIVDAITYKPGWYLRTGIEEGRMWVQVGVTDEAEISYDPIANKKVPWRGAKHYLSPHMCRQEIVGTVLHAIERAEMHEVHEWFRYRGRSIYNPHLDPDALVEVARFSRNFNTRENAMTMDES